MMIDRQAREEDPRNAALGRHPPIDPGIADFLGALSVQPQQTDDIQLMRKAAAAARFHAHKDQRLRADPPSNRASGTPTRIATKGHDLLGLSFAPEGQAQGLILYFHGGGWSLLSAETHAPIMTHLAETSGAIVVGPDVPLAPEVRFPDLLDVCVSCIETLREMPATKAQCKQGIILAGDSSGANLALATALTLRDTGRPMPDGLILAYGVLDCDLTRSSYGLFGDPPYPLSAERMDRFWSFYCREETDRGHERASPLRADQNGLPPTRIIIAEQDVLRDENIALAVKMERAGVEVTRDHIDVATHAFWEACLHSKVSAGSIASAGRWARDRFDQAAEQRMEADQ